MKQLKLQEPCCGYQLEVDCTCLDDGLAVLLIGGCTSHVGSVSVGTPDGGIQTIRLPNHRDNVLSEQWAARLSAVFHTTACVSCGIHYDCITKEQLSQVISISETLLNKLEQTLQLAGYSTDRQQKG